MQSRSTPELEEVCVNQDDELDDLSIVSVDSSDSPQSQPNVPINPTLPLELFLKISSYFKNLTDVIHLASVNKEFREVFEQQIYLSFEVNDDEDVTTLSEYLNHMHMSTAQIQRQIREASLSPISMQIARANLNPIMCGLSVASYFFLANIIIGGALFGIGINSKNIEQSSAGIGVLLGGSLSSLCTITPLVSCGITYFRRKLDKSNAKIGQLQQSLENLPKPRLLSQQ
ncbi:MAG: hypothetical protein KIT56_03690 [Gammaproteobacteria bacterium]|nr:hypothetical protein [Gammaproteobacteria bacterium]MCW5582978.1 hypothetical protein [Gammaproteobacteria bacterium]